MARDLGLPTGWLNNGPSRGEGGLFQLGLPAGFVGRLTGKNYGSRLAVHFSGRWDQIHFKLYAAADQRDGTQLTDLKALDPSAAELGAAARWAITQQFSLWTRWEPPGNGAYLAPCLRKRASVRRRLRLGRSLN